MIKRRGVQAAKLSSILLLLLVLIAPEWPAFADEKQRLKEIVGLREFDFLVWESNAFLDKGESLLVGGQRFLDEDSRKSIVLKYLSLVDEANHIEGQINATYRDPTVLDPNMATQQDQESLEGIRTDLNGKQLIAEAIVQEQVAAILSEEGFDFAGETWPPVMMRVSPLPSILIVSPREKIEKLYQVPLVTGLTTPDKEEMETAVYGDLDRSALVVPIGGLGTYPAMIMETSDINRLAEVVSHEWVHHWLTLQPLGLNYMMDPDVRIINETVASLVDEELGTKVVERYYPELLPPPPPEAPEAPLPSEPPDYDFAAELAQTRVRVDELLAEGKIDEAEAYMEERRLEFLDHGYGIRKLNQAYFAFFGAYAAEPGGAQGSNPIGPMLRDIRQETPSIQAFLKAVAPITSFADLIEVHQRITSGQLGN